MYKIKNILFNYEGRARRQTSSYLVPHGYQVKKKIFFLDCIWFEIHEAGFNQYP
jgi:hypothetical protein